MTSIGAMMIRDFREDERDALKGLLSSPCRWLSKTMLWQENLKWEKPKEEEEVVDDDFSVKSLWLQVEMYGHDLNHCSWFTVSVPVVDPSGNSDRPDFPPEVISPVQGLEQCDLQRAVAFPPGRIFCFGGSYRSHIIVRQVIRDGDLGTGVKCIDVSNILEEPKEWEVLPDMVAGRDFPSAFVFKGKIYVFGGLRSPICGSVVEVYDPNSQTWEELNYGPFIEDDDLPPLYAHIPGGLFVDKENGEKHLLFRSDPHEGLTTMYTFNLDTNQIFSAETPFPDLYHGAVVVDGLLYAYLHHTGDIRAYDLEEKIWIPEPVTGLDTIQPMLMLRLLLIGGKRLCLIYKDSAVVTEGDQYWRSLRIIVTVFQVDGLQAKVLSSRSFIIPHGLVLNDCLIL